jgi:hypothetical protein|tara:strand:- start:1704 stop:3665 length:1962 start_codon:yes stop_codon:yes gene_type:complete
MILYKLLVSSKYIPRRNFRFSTSYKDYRIISYIFRNKFFRRLLFLFSNCLSKNTQISKSIKNRLFEYQAAPVILGDHKLVNFNKKKYLLIDFSHETRKSVVIKPAEFISTEVVVKQKMEFLFSIAVLENLVMFNKKVIKNDLECKIFINNDKDELLKKLIFQIPIDKKKHGLLRKNLGDNWVDLSLNLSDFAGESIKLSISCGFVNETFTMYERKSKKKKYSFVNIPCIAIGSPKIINKKDKKKNILYISGESLTDPFFIKKKYGDDIKFPNIEKLASESIHYTRSYSIGDSTLPTILAFKTGLFPSQHGFGDYSLPVYEENQSEKMSSIPQMLNEKDFYTKSIVSYPRFDPLYGWAVDFDSYFQAEFPFHSDAPDAARIIRNFESEKNHDLFIFTHMTRVHGPFLSGDDTQTPNRISTEELDTAMEDNFVPLYISQLKVFDEQIGQISDYLKRTNQYDNTMIILVGDHGVSMPPKWDFNKNVYAHYEEHSRVPLIIKPAVWSKSVSEKIDIPVTAQKKIFDEILSHNNIKIPKENISLPQYSEDFKELAISETVYHPEKDNYAIMIASSDFKYWFISKVDWKKFEILSIIDEKLYIVGSDGMVDEANNLAKEENYNKVTLDFRQKGCQFFKQSSEYRKKFPISRFPNTLKIE